MKDFPVEFTCVAPAKECKKSERAQTYLKWIVIMRKSINFLRFLISVSKKCKFSALTLHKFGLSNHFSSTDFSIETLLSTWSTGYLNSFYKLFDNGWQLHCRICSSVCLWHQCGKTKHQRTDIKKKKVWRAFARTAIAFIMLCTPVPVGIRLIDNRQ